MTNWLANLKLPQKLLIMALLGAVMVATPTYMYKKTLDAGIAASELEAAGIPPVRALLGLIQVTQQHRGLSAGVLAGNASLAGKREAKLAEVTAALEATVKAFGKDLAGTDAEKVWQESNDAWKSLSGDVASRAITSPESTKRHAALIAKYLNLMELLLDFYGHSYDPEARTYHVIIGTLLHMPRLTEVMGQARARGTGILQAKAITTEERIQLSGLVELGKQTFGDMESNLSKAIAMDATIKSSIGALAGESDAAARSAFKLLTEEVVNADKLSYPSADYFAQFTERIDKQFALNAKALDLLEKLILERIADSRGSGNRVLGLIALLTLIVAAIGYLVTRSIQVPLGRAIDVANAIAGGRLDNDIRTDSTNETGQLMKALGAMQTDLSARIAADKKIADENLRIKIALDNVSTGVMIADPSREIIYVNKAVTALLHNAESAIRKALPNFSADKLVGTNIDSFHKNPAHQANLLGTFTSQYVANLEIGGRSLRVTAAPVINEQNERLGAVAEWLDRTQEVAVEKEVAGMVQKAQKGEFDTRISLEGKDGFFRQLAEGLNSLSEVTSSGLNDVAGVLQSIAQGDLTQTISGDFSGIFGQLKDDTNATVERLREVITRIKDATDTINTAAKEIAAGNSDLSARTEQQASSLEETSSSMEELNATVKNNADNANRANALAKTSNSGILKGGDAVKQVVATMGEIQASSKKIADIIGVIDSIAFQTNILALNAAVEAARAGEQGRGFAVVATEVRNLAQRSATAAKEIKDLIAASVNTVDAGARQVEDAGKTIEDVVTSFGQVSGLVTDIANASREQAAGIEQVTKAVGSMDEATQQNAALVEQSAAAAESLEEQARGLVQSVSVFKLAEGQARLPAPVAARPAKHSPPRQATPAKAPVKALPKKAGLPASEDGEEWAEF